MNFDRSSKLIQETADTKVVPPLATRARRSIKNLLVFSVPIILVVAVLVIGLWSFTGFRFWYIMAPTVFVAWFLIYRQYWKWSRNHDRCDPVDGLLHVEDHAHPFILFGITGSSDDQIPLDSVNLDTPTRSLIDKYIFNCCTLIAGSKSLPGVRNAEALKLIKKYRESMRREAIELDRMQVDVQMATLQTLEDIGRKLDRLTDLALGVDLEGNLKNLVREVGSISAAAARLDEERSIQAREREDRTQPLPIAKSTKPKRSVKDDSVGSQNEPPRQDLSR